MIRSGEIQKPVSRLTTDERPQIEENVKAEETTIVDCKTPTGKEHRIPDVRTCPPAPKKPRASPDEFSEEFRVMKSLYAPIMTDLNVEDLWSSTESP
ncbi:hypothetical protein M5689_010273 [Euphorbia peplus]|nr:hypothetical protein M5689_010273 [Euphorbia peplus]